MAYDINKAMVNEVFINNHAIRWKSEALPKRDTHVKSTLALTIPVNIKYDWLDLTVNLPES